MNYYSVIENKQTLFQGFAEIRQAVEEAFPTAQITEFIETEVPGIYEA